MPRDAIATSQRKPIRKSIFPVGGKQRAQTQALRRAVCYCSGGCRGRAAEPLRSAALAAPGRAGPGPGRAGRWWHPAAAARAQGSAQLGGKRCQPPNFATLQHEWGFFKCMYMYSQPPPPPYQPSSTVTNMTNDLVSFSFKSQFFNKLGKSHFRSSGLKGLLEWWIRTADFHLYQQERVFRS